MNIISKLLTTLLVVSFSTAAFGQTTLLKVGSTVSLTIKGVPLEEQSLVSGNFVVGEKGGLYLPMLDKPIQAAGKSPGTLARQIETAYKKEEIYTQPRITIINMIDEKDKELNAERTVTVGGQVRAPGPVVFRKGLTLYEAVQAARGENEFGSIYRVRVTRGKTMKVYDLSKVANKQFKLQPRDIIEVPQKKIWE